MQANINVYLMKSFKKGSLPWILNGQDKINMRFITLTNLNSIPHSIQIDWKLCEIIGAEVFAFSQSCDLESTSRSIRLVLKCRVQYYLLSYQVWIKSTHTHPNVCQCQSFLTQSVKQQLFLLLHKILLKRSRRMLPLNCFITSNFILIWWKVWVKMKPRGFALHDLVTSRQSQDQWKRYKMVAVNGTFKYDRCEKIWLTVWVQCPTFKFLPHKTDGWPDKHNSLQRSICYSYGSINWNKLTHMRCPYWGPE